MWQRNDTGHVVDVAAHPSVEHPDWHPFSVGPGEVKDWPEALAGFTAVDGPDPAVIDDPVQDAPVRDSAPAKTARKRAAAAATPEGDETQ